ncbi:MAG: IS630 family transposase [Nitrospira sp.]|nr:IS630 family transposase [Nitrospira sp.]
MDKQDARSIPPAAQEALRFRAVQAVLSGKLQKEVIAFFDISQAALTKWLKLYRQGGEAALKPRKRGRHKSIQLEGWQAAQTVKTIIDHCPDQIKLPWVLWTREAVARMIKERYGIAISRWTAGRYLDRWGFTPQKPAKRALERNPEAVMHWLDTEYPAIKKAAQQEQAEIHWGDEMGLRSDHQTGTTWGLKGKTPVVASTGKRFSGNMISTITNRGTMRFMVFTSSFTTDVFIAFLRRLIASADQKIYLIVDNHRVHHAGKVLKWIDKHHDRISIFYLPPYSPDLNPDERLNNDVKVNASRDRRPANKAELLENMRYYLRVTQNRPDIVKSYFKDRPVQYAA